MSMWMRYTVRSIRSFAMHGSLLYSIMRFSFTISVTFLLPLIELTFPYERSFVARTLPRSNDEQWLLSMRDMATSQPHTPQKHTQ